MRKARRDPSVKKSLVRDAERDISKHVVKSKEGSEPLSRKPTRDRSLDQQFHLEYDLTNPKLCTTKMITNQISNIKRKPPPAVNLDDVNPEKPLIAAMMTKKFNFHVNERVYGNLVEINTNTIPERKSRRRSPVRCHSVSRDAEPKLEDFYVKTESVDRPRILTCARPKYKFVTPFDEDRLHKIFYNT